MKKIQACLLCGEPLEYLQKAEQMRCVDCGQSFFGNARCKAGHFICDNCHSRRGLEQIARVCLAAKNENPAEIAIEMMRQPFVYMHGPEHHSLIGAALLAAYENSGGKIDSREEALKEITRRAKAVPGGACGFWGACGAGVGAGIFLSVVLGATPLSKGSWGSANELTAACLSRIGQAGGPRCCKRNVFLALMEASSFISQRLGVQMQYSSPKCSFFGGNEQCKKTDCPFYPGK